MQVAGDIAQWSYAPPIYRAYAFTNIDLRMLNKEVEPTLRR